MPTTTYAAEIKADSVSPDGVRLTTFVFTLPRIVLAELNTHRMLSKNSASSRAIPVEVMLKRIEEDPYIPPFAKNQKGMQPGEELSGEELQYAIDMWLLARDQAVDQARMLAAAGVHKQWANRLVEPWMWTQVVISGTEWTNFFALRCHKDAAIDIRAVAWEAFKSYSTSTPRPLRYGEWHKPFMDQHTGPEFDALDEATLKKVSVGRCARVSYFTHEGESSWEADAGLHDRLLNEENPTDPGHWSPFEHVATPIELYAGGARDNSYNWSGNFFGWKQYRKKFPRENVTELPPYLLANA